MALVREPEGKKSLGRRRLKWEDNTKTDPRLVRCGHGLD